MPLVSKQSIVLVFILLTLPTLSACQSGETGTPPVSTLARSAPTVAANASPIATSSASRPPVPAPTVAAPAATAAKGIVDMTFGPGTFSFPDPKAGLANLSSYGAALTLSFVGTRDGQIQKWTKNYIMLAAKKLAARQLSLAATGDLSDLTPKYMAELDGTAYVRRGTSACTATVIDPGNSLAQLQEPAGFLTGVIGADEVGSETVNGAAAKHYTFDERAFGQSGLAKSTGEMWVASEGGYIVRYKVATTGTAVYFGEGVQGTLTWDYELTGANQPVAIELPKDCPAGMVNAPVLPDAANVLRIPGLLSYSTPSSLAQTAAFYQKQIPLLGYKLLGNPITTDTLALLDYTQGAGSMSVMIIAGQGGTTVRIVLGARQP